MDKSLIKKNDMIVNGAERYAVIGALGTVLYVQETDALPQQTVYQLEDVEP